MALMMAAKGRVGVLEVLLTSTVANLSLTDKDSNTALHLACSNVGQRRTALRGWLLGREGERGRRGRGRGPSTRRTTRLILGVFARKRGTLTATTVLRELFLKVTRKLVYQRAVVYHKTAQT
ncbi:unnamed protein product [Gadus morhua 'NCC']